jgi:hypothetical protein
MSCRAEKNKLPGFPDCSQTQNLAQQRDGEYGAARVHFPRFSLLDE